MQAASRRGRGETPILLPPADWLKANWAASAVSLGFGAEDNDRMPDRSKPQPIYLDHHATTPLDGEVLAAMMPHFTGAWGNPASVNHRYGIEAAKAVERARRQVAMLVTPNSSDIEHDAKSIVFTSGATEANNLALKGVLGAAAKGAHLIVTAADHKSVLDPAKTLARAGYELTVLDVDRDGRVSAEEVAAAIRPNTALVSVIMASNEVGSINDVWTIGEVCRASGVLFHTDAVQSAAVCKIDLASAPIDLVSLSAHKMYGPQGIGALFVRRDGAGPRIRVAPLIEGGGHERKLRSGTVPTALAVGFGKACELCRERMESDGERIACLRDRLWQTLQRTVGGVAMNGCLAPRLPGNLSVRIEGVRSEALLAKLQDCVAASSGAACSTADPRPSHVLMAMGLTETEIASTVRFGLGRFTTEQEIDRAAAAIAQAVEGLR
jgi:cysteine desulfurase